MMTLEQIEQQYPIHLRPFQRNIMREYFQYKILEVIFASPIAAKLSFLGGTALRIIYGNTRFSEDLDFDNFGLQKEDFATLGEDIKTHLEREGLINETRITTKGAFRCQIKLPQILFQHGLSPLANEKIMIQIDTAPHRFAYTPDQKMLNKFDVFTTISVTPAPLLLSQKIYAAVACKRPMGRDFYDIVFLLSLTKPEYAYLKEKIGIADAQQLRATLVETTQRYDMKTLARDVQPFLFTPSDAKKVTLFEDFIRTAALE